MTVLNQPHVTDSIKHILDPTPYDRRDFYLGNSSVRRSGGRKTQFTRELYDEYLKCAEDFEYFAKNYVYVLNLDKGMVLFEPYEYQRKMWHIFDDNRFSIVLACRQSGKTAGVVAYLIWYTLFHRDQNVAVVAHEAGQAREILARYTLALENLPFFLQPGCRTLNKGKVVFDNNTTIFAASATSSSLRGKSISLLYLDEFAFVEHDDEFMRSTYPIVSSGKNSKIIVTSTANGITNQFFKLWDKATKKQNTFTPFRVDWWDVPGRDEAWKKMTIDNTSEQQFAVEFGNEFLGSSDTLVNGKALQAMSAVNPIWNEDEHTRVYSHPIKAGQNYMKPDGSYDIDAIDHDYIMTVDVAKGRGKDYSTFTVWDISVLPYEQVCVYQDAWVSPIIFPQIIFKWARIYNDALVVIESNDQGASVARSLLYDLNYEHVYTESLTKADGIGVFVDVKVKATGCSNLKDLIESGNMLLRDFEAIVEIKGFERDKKSWAAADSGHDDLVSNMWLLAWFTSTPTFEARVKGMSLRDIVYKDRQQLIDQSVPPFGIIDDGINPVGIDAIAELFDNGYLPPDFAAYEELSKRGYIPGDFTQNWEYNKIKKGYSPFRD